MEKTPTGRIPEGPEYQELPRKLKPDNLIVGGMGGMAAAAALVMGAGLGASRSLWESEPLTGEMSIREYRNVDFPMDDYLSRMEMYRTPQRRHGYTPAKPSAAKIAKRAKGKVQNAARSRNKKR